jgi:GNAT superfamily N-acetyltransferase
MAKPRAATTGSDVVQIRLTDVDEMRSKGADLFLEHYQEIARDKDVMKLAPFWLRYYALEEEGKLVALAAFDEDRIIGYAVSILEQHLHYSGQRVLFNDVVFVTKSHRKGDIGLRLIWRLENLARENGCAKIAFHVKPNTAMQRLLGKAEYKTEDVILTKVIEPEED